MEECEGGATSNNNKAQQREVPPTSDLRRLLLSSEDPVHRSRSCFKFKKRFLPPPSTLFDSRSHDDTIRGTKAIVVRWLRSLLSLRIRVVLSRSMEGEADLSDEQGRPEVADRWEIVSSWQLEAPVLATTIEIKGCSLGWDDLQSLAHPQLRRLSLRAVGVILSCNEDIMDLADHLRSIVSLESFSWHGFSRHYLSSFDWSPLLEALASLPRLRVVSLAPTDGPLHLQGVPQASLAAPVYNPQVLAESPSLQVVEWINYPVTSCLAGFGRIPKTRRVGQPLPDLSALDPLQQLEQNVFDACSLWIHPSRLDRRLAVYDRSVLFAILRDDPSLILESLLLKLTSLGEL